MERKIKFWKVIIKEQNTRKATVELFYSRSGMGTITTYPTPKWRFVFAILLPSLVLGIIPFIIWMFIPSTYVMWNSIIFIFSLCNLNMSTVDLNTIFHAITEMPKGSVMQTSGMDYFWYIPNSENK
ncbi:DUF3267 domain-containing protein [Clostridium sp. JNZ X4-2]